MAMKPKTIRDLRDNGPAVSRYRAKTQAMYRTYRWRKASRDYRRSHPVCELCRDEGRVSLAQCVDHIEPHYGDPAKFWDVNNWQSACKPCHSRKTWQEMKRTPGDANL